MTLRDFPRAELAAGWYLERHAGWSLVAGRPELKLLEQQRGPLRRVLLLSHGASREAIEQALAMLSYPRALTSLTIHDFAASPGDSPLDLPGWRLREVTSRQWFGVGTYIHDLALDEATLFARIHKGKQQEIRRAPRRGLRVELSCFPDASRREEFRQLHDEMARERGLRRVGRPHIDRLLAAGDALLVQAFDRHGATVAMNLVYLQPTHGYYCRSPEVASGFLRPMRPCLCDRPYPLGLSPSPWPTHRGAPALGAAEKAGRSHPAVSFHTDGRGAPRPSASVVRRRRGHVRCGQVDGRHGTNRLSMA